MYVDAYDRVMAQYVLINLQQFLCNLFKTLRIGNDYQT